MRLVSLLLLFLLACGRTFAAGAAIPSGAITVSGNQLTTQAGQNIRASCVDYTGSTPATDIPLMRSAGFNCVRVGWFDKTLSLPTLDAVVSAATTNSMRVIIAHLGNEASAACGARQGNGVWYDLNGAAPWNTTNNTDGCGNAGTILYSTFKTNWTNIATHYAGNETVMGFDLHHEPVVSGTGLTAPVNWGGGGGSSGTPRDRLLAYLQSIAGSHILFGQTTHSDNRSEFDADTQAFGFSPAIMFNDPWLDQFGTSAVFNNAFMSQSLAHAASGGIVGLSMQLPNPVDLGPTQNGTAVDPVALLTPGSPTNTNLNNMLNQAAGLLQQHKDAGHAVLVRYEYELDGTWFWWGVQQFSVAQQIQLFQYITNYLRVTKGLDNLLTTFSVNNSAASYPQYPGDAFVDIVGVDAYTNSFGSYSGIYNTLHAMAPSKLIAFTESGSGGPGASDPNYDLNRFKADVSGSMPLMVYANWWPGWQPSLYVNGKAAMSDPYWVNKSQVNIPAGVGGSTNGSDALAMCNDIGAAVTTADSTALIICEGPVNSGALFNGATNSTAVGDLTLAQTSPVVGTTSGGATRNVLTTIPFASNSVWNIGIGSNATWSSDSDADQVTLHNAGGGFNSSNFGAPIFFGQQSDPLITITSSNPSGIVPTVQMHVPANAAPSNDSDAEITLVDSTQPTIVFSGSNACTFNNGSDISGGLHCGIGNVYNPSGNGLTDTSNYDHGNKSGYNDTGQFPGILTDYDLSQGVIDHALRYSMSTDISLNPGPGGNHSGIYGPCENVPWPAYCVDGNAQNTYSGNILAGVTLGIPASVNINSLGLSQGGLMLAKALQTYGLMWRDAGGTNAINLYTTPEADNNTLFQQARSDWQSILVHQLHIMRNQSGQGPTGAGVAGQINGGGNYPTPLPAGCAQASPTLAGSTCSGGSGTAIPAAKVVYSVHEFPQNVGGRSPDSSTPWITLSNTAYGYLETNNIAPVFIGSMGASLDGSNGAIGDDQGWASTIGSWVNGSAANGPSFATCQQPMSTSWHLWGAQPTLNPNGTNNADGTFRSGQQSVWSTLQFTPTCTGGSGVQTTWNPSDNLNTTLTGNNLIATTNAAEGAVRSTTSKSTGKVCAEFTASTNLTADWDVGLADSTFALNGSQGGLGGDTHGGGFDLLSGPGLGIFFNNVILSFFGTAGDVTGNKATMCADLDAKLVWFTSNYMRAQGNPWNNSATANPATATGGLSFSGLTCPCFLTYQNFENGSAATLNTRAPFAVGTPAGFSAWDTGVVSTTHPILLNLGKNDALPSAANDDVRVALNQRSYP